MNILAESRLHDFTNLVRLGVQSFVKAGELLCELVAEDPRACDQILAMEGNKLSRGVLEKFLAMGRHTLHPTLVMHDTPAAQRLALLPYEDQERLFHARVKVVTRVKGIEGEVEKPVCNLNAKEAARVIGENGIRSVGEQRRLLHAYRSGGRKYSGPRSSAFPRDVQLAVAGEEEATAAGGHHSLFNPAAAAPPAASRLVPVELGPDHTRNLIEWLDAAQQALLEGRSSLTMIHQREHPKDRHIEAALRELGQLRFAASEGEL